MVEFKEKLKTQQEIEKKLLLSLQKQGSDVEEDENQSEGYFSSESSLSEVYISEISEHRKVSKRPKVPLLSLGLLNKDSDSSEDLNYIKKKTFGTDESNNEEDTFRYKENDYEIE